MQRFFDIVFASLGLVFLAPVLLPVAVILRFTGEGEVFFRQTRIGKGGKPFKVYKFATMLKDSPNIGTGTVTVKNDPRVLPLGHFLRKTKINELPQLLNVLNGSMSMVGPRPQAKKNFAAFPIEFQRLIVTVRPGLSGIGPIVFRGEEEILAEHARSVDFYDNFIAPYKGEVEAWYIGRDTLSNYFAIILVTFWVVFFPSSRAVWSVFKDLPVPPKELISPLKYPERG